ncbi:nucleotidyltransferase family protein [Jiella avicenniae]|uniref:Nucleotidyltransferase domain-containing protein n=1 Tax=Jiella avicenniae TaxID=2907202 RepID=A0A9X1NVX9_9HYPH|nr:nucleotidyltransferase domain-containing protein [Jiella avicenniae]MCE7026492.1 nucleotidyltransferase domain-containing protein [Jiella avicenniae]
MTKTDHDSSDRGWSLYETRQLRRAAEHLAAHTHAEAVILFGSRARGDNGPDSDWDLCVILPDTVGPGLFNPVNLWSEASGFGLPIQVFPIRRSIFIERSADINSLSHDVLRDGRPIIGHLECFPGIMERA